MVQVLACRLFDVKPLPSSMLTYRKRDHKENCYQNLYLYKNFIQVKATHYCDAIMGTVASQITSLTIVYTTVYSDADQSKHQSSASLDFVWGIHRGPAQMASTAENVSIWWRHHVNLPFATFNPQCDNIQIQDYFDIRESSKLLVKSKTIWDLEITQVKQSVNVSLDIKIYVNINVLTKAETLKEHFPKIFYLIMRRTKQQNAKQ